MTRFTFALAVLLLAVASRGSAQNAHALPGCESRAEVTKAFHEFDTPAFERLDAAESTARKQQVFTALIAKYPREIRPYNSLIALLREQQDTHPERLRELQAEYSKQASAHPDDPLALYLAAHALRGTDTPQSIGLLNKAQTLAPGFVWPTLDLANIYSSGKFADQPKFTENLTGFWTACPTSRNENARWMLVKDLALQSKVATAERAALAKETDPERLKNYEFLWGLEFRTRLPQEFGAERQQIAEDLKRLGHANRHPDAAWAAFMIKGYRQSQAAPKLMPAREDALVAQYPHSDEAYEIVRARWQKAHKKPEDAKDTAAWSSYRLASAAAQQQWMKSFQDSFLPPDYYRFFALENDYSLSQPQGVAMADAFVKAVDTHFGTQMQTYAYLSAGSFLLDHNWDPAKALSLFQKALEAQDRDDATFRARDDRSAEELSDHATDMRGMDRYLKSEILLAAMRAHRPDAVQSLRASIEAPRAADYKNESGYWANRAHLAVIDGRKQDALAYYQLALRARSHPPQYQEGRFVDELNDDAHALWEEQGGSEVAWTAWSAAPPASAAKADEARWEKPTKDLPAFQLADLSGKTWSSKTINGKTVLINLWATWCGPCNAELPQLQKLYEQTKNRSDLQIVTFNMDEDPGLVEPFMKDKGYTFPVVPAYSYVVSLLDGYAIPQNWIVNPQGKWQWTQVGFGSDDAWQKDMLAKLDSVKGGS